jgi:hypothetical protein
MAELPRELRSAEVLRQQAVWDAQKHARVGCV